MLTVPRDEARRRISEQIARAEEILARPISSEEEFTSTSAEFWRWRDFVDELLSQLITTDDYRMEFSRPTYSITAVPIVRSSSPRPQTPPLGERVQSFLENATPHLNRLKSIEPRIELLPVEDGAVHTETVDKLPQVLHVLNRFHTIVRQLRRRHDDRSTLDVRDEYDVQDLLHALLLSITDDVRDEEGSPSVAGSSPRIDFLLKVERILIEVKMTRSGLTDKKLGDELAIDIQRYRGHPDYDTLVFFIYDPSDTIRRRASMVNDNSGFRDGKRVVVVINPD